MLIVLEEMLMLLHPFSVEAAAPELTSPSVVLMEASTGTVIYEKAGNEQRSPASITKIMTLLLIFDAIESGQINLTDEVVTSEYAKSMGGSQVFIETGEIQTVDTLIKCIVIASGNDASVAMAEYVSGTESSFVEEMNQKAAELGMVDTHFEDCCGLSSSPNHYTSAYDVALMSKALVTTYPEIFDYTSIWMEDIVHNTAQGSSVFTLSSTNKLLRQYEYATGLKTGSTDAAKYCLSATANKNGIDMIAVIMAAPDFRVRFQEAQILLEYGYSICNLYIDENTDPLPNSIINRGVEDDAAVAYEAQFRYLSTDGSDISGMEKKSFYMMT